MPAVLALLLLLAAPLPAHDPKPVRATRKVLLVTLDGMRWQEVFGGADNQLMNRDYGGVRELLAMRRRFWRGRILMPFLWDTIASFRCRPSCSACCSSTG